MISHFYCQQELPVAAMALVVVEADATQDEVVLLLAMADEAPVVEVVVSSLYHHGPSFLYLISIQTHPLPTFYCFPRSDSRQWRCRATRGRGIR